MIENIPPHPDEPYLDNQPSIIGRMACVVEFMDHHQWTLAEGIQELVEMWICWQSEPGEEYR